jgi:pimeloyl-ACP methyl ester carboxylesterase
LVKADVFGYSMGGSVALQMAIRHPQLIDSLVVASAPYSSDGYQPGLIDMIQSITPDVFIGTPIEAEYVSLAPNPEAFPTLVEKLVAFDSEPFDWPAEDIEGIASRTLLIMGDADTILPEHFVEIFRLLGGGVNGDLAGLPDARLAVLPGTTHIGVIYQVDRLDSIITEFLDTPLPE